MPFLTQLLGSGGQRYDGHSSTSPFNSTSESPWAKAPIALLALQVRSPMGLIKLKCNYLLHFFFILCTKWYLSSGPLRLHFSLSLFAVLFLLCYLVILLFWMHFHLIPKNPSTLVEVLLVCKLSIHLFSILASSSTRNCRDVPRPCCHRANRAQALLQWSQRTQRIHTDAGRTMLTPQRKVPGLESNPQPSVKETVRTTATACPVSSPHSSAHIIIHKAENHNPPL